MHVPPCLKKKFSKPLNISTIRPSVIDIDEYNTKSLRLIANACINSFIMPLETYTCFLNNYY